MRKTIAILMLAWSFSAEAAPRAELWARWEAHDDASTASIEHSVWNRLLQTYVRVGSDGIARIPYSGVSTSDRDALAADLSRLASLPISAYSRREQFAFWVDLYNELTAKLVLTIIRYRASRTSTSPRDCLPLDPGAKS